MTYLQKPAYTDEQIMAAFQRIRRTGFTSGLLIERYILDEAKLLHFYQWPCGGFEVTDAGRSFLEQYGEEHREEE